MEHKNKRGEVNMGDFLLQVGTPKSEYKGAETALNVPQIDYICQVITIYIDFDITFYKYIFG